MPGIPIPNAPNEPGYIPGVPAGVMVADGPPADFQFEGAGFYDTVYQITGKFFRNEHKWMLGLTSPDKYNGLTAAFVQLAQPTLIWVCDWEASKTGNQPNIPDPTPQDDNWELLDSTIGTVNLLIGPQGNNPQYRMTGTYIYGHKNPNAILAKNVTFPRLPWVKDVYDRSLPESKLDASLVAPGIGAGVSIGGIGAGQFRP